MLISILYSITMAGQYRASEWEARDEWQNTSEIFENMELGPSMKVADIGCHEGYLTLKMAPIVGEQGMVYAVDIEKYKLNRLDKRLDEMSISNVTTIHGQTDNPKLPKDELDRLIFLDTYHEIEEYEKVLTNVYQALKPGGKLVMIEPLAQSRRTWSREDQADKHEISIKYAINDLQEAGFQITKTVDPFIDRPSKSDQMWMIVAIKPESH